MPVAPLVVVPRLALGAAVPVPLEPKLPPLPVTVPVPAAHLTRSAWLARRPRRQTATVPPVSDAWTRSQASPVAALALASSPFAPMAVTLPCARYGRASSALHPRHAARPVRAALPITPMLRAAGAVGVEWIPPRPGHVPGRRVKPVTVPRRPACMGRGWRLHAGWLSLHRNPLRPAPLVEILRPILRWQGVRALLRLRMLVPVLAMHPARACASPAQVRVHSHPCLETCRPFRPPLWALGSPRIETPFRAPVQGRRLRMRRR